MLEPHLPAEAQTVIEMNSDEPPLLSHASVDKQRTRTRTSLCR